MRKRLKPGDIVDFGDMGRMAVSGFGYDWVVLREVNQPYRKFLYDGSMERLEEEYGQNS